MVCGVGACLCVQQRVFKRPAAAGSVCELFFGDPTDKLEDTPFALPVPRPPFV